MVLRFSRWTRPAPCALTAFGILFVPAAHEGRLAGQAPQQTKGAAKAAVPADAPKFKAIWEPVNVPHDLELTSIHFASAEEGWVAGGKNAMNGGVIFHTSDGGNNWELQSGDTESSDRAIGHLRILNAKLGFAVQSASGGGHTLLRTTDGKTWAPSGTVAEHRLDYQFTSQDVGFYTSGEQIFRTRNGGRGWESVFRGGVRVEVQGLTREVPCQFWRMHFVNSNLGFALGRPMADGAGIVVARTEDGGTTWKLTVVLSGEAAQESALRFFDDNTGVLRTQNGKLFRTADGGQTWTGASGAAGGSKPEMEFADPQVGWMMRYRTMAYTTNGGASWVSREIGFPAMVNAFCLVQRDRGYAAGEHGMVYRYRVVPMDYTSKGMLAAPAMPAR